MKPLSVFNIYIYLFDKFMCSWIPGTRWPRTRSRSSRWRHQSRRSRTPPGRCQSSQSQHTRQQSLNYNKLFFICLLLFFFILIFLIFYIQFFILKNLDHWIKIGFSSLNKPKKKVCRGVQRGGACPPSEFWPPPEEFWTVFYLNNVLQRIIWIFLITCVLLYFCHLLRVGGKFCSMVQILFLFHIVLRPISPTQKRTSVNPQLRTPPGATRASCCSLRITSIEKRRVTKVSVKRGSPFRNFLSFGKFCIAFYLKKKKCTVIAGQVIPIPHHYHSALMVTSETLMAHN